MELVDSIVPGTLPSSLTGLEMGVYWFRIAQGGTMLQGYPVLQFNPSLQKGAAFFKVIVERHPGSQISDLDKHKFLVPNDITVAQFMWIIRKRLQLSPEKALFLFFDDYVPQTSWTMGQLYNERKSDDGFLYAHYSGENSFGGV
ncbi:Gamma-aminobutyric acid receptor-associated protein-like protein [Echinococcus granulosus]|uniref:Gamma-aminobutyric acid receptor-associated protein-like protein n=1 Tax=Echinococcus granulosus TaxID=6210 RepID=W6UIU6_ECHGR|nr:Gamma-aminobutyric acid receptor-associated protein-like protein [Echinococcus granulosus]EUB58057.1 Gamma-aminobutyric acid receptor-associated protein-like protein [Echinococcus granulosus]